MEDQFFSDDEDSQMYIECETCNIEFSNLKSYEQHLKGKKHHKMLRKLKIISKVSEMSKKKKDSDEENFEFSADPNTIECEVCQKSFSGHVTYYTHLKGSKHSKNLKKEKLKKHLKDMPEVLGNNADSDDSEDEGILAKPFARCDTCKKEFSGPESFHQHVKSTSHKKKLKLKSVIADIKSKHSENMENAVTEEDNFECELCEKSFSGPVPYHMHMSSNVHKKGVKRVEMISEIKDFCKPMDDDKVFVCRECEKNFTDPFALKTHLDSDDHDKQKSKKEILEFLSLHSELTMVRAIINENSDDEDGDSSFFVCKVCHISLTGAESAKAHATSKKHVAAKKEHKEMKLLKLQKRQTNANKVEEDQANGTCGKNILPSSEIIKENASCADNKDHLISDFVNLELVR